MLTPMASRLATTCATGALSVFLCLPAPARADADALVDNLGPREIAVGEAMRGGAVGASAVTQNPAGLPLTRELVFEGGYGYRVTDSASIISASACDSTNAAPGCFFYSFLGASPRIDGMTYDRTIHTAGMTLSRSLSPRIMMGSAIKYFNVSSTLMDEGDASGFTWDLGLTLRLTEIASLGIAGYNLYGEEAPQFPRAVGGGVALRPIPTLRATFDALFHLGGDDKTGRFGGGLEYFLQLGSKSTGYPIRAGALRDRAQGRTYLSAGLGLTSAKLGVDVAARRALGGDEELLVIAALRFFGPREASPSLSASPEL
jgi:hypothetical protein